MEKARLIYVGVMVIFGSIGLFVKFIDLPSGMIALIRGIIGSFFLLAAMAITRRKVSWEDIKSNLAILIASGAAIGFNWIFLFEAYKFTTVSIATIVYNFAPVFVVLFSILFLKERLSLYKVASVAIAVVGMFMIVGNSNGQVGTNHLYGIAYGLLAGALYAGVILFNRFIKGLSGVESTLVQLGVASIVLLPYVLVTGKIDLTGLSLNTYILLLTVGIVNTGLAYYLYFSSMQKLSSQSIAVLSYIGPLSAVVLSRIILKELMSLTQFFGGILILGSALLSEYYGNRDLAKAKSKAT